MTKDFYRQRAQQFSQQANIFSNQLRVNSWLRIFAVLVFGLGVYASFQQLLWLALVALSIVLFMVLVQRHARLEDKKHHLDQLVRLNQWEEQALDHIFHFPDGSSFQYPHHPYAHDLDLFGPGSLFQYINRCATQIGERKLADELKTLPYTIEQLHQREEAVKELSTLIDLRQNVWAIGKRLGEGDFPWHALTAWLNEMHFIYRNRFLSFLKWLLPAIAVAIVGLVVYGASYITLLFAIMGIQLAITGFYNKRIDKMQHALAGGKELLEGYSKIFTQIASHQFSSSLLKHHHETAAEAAGEVKAFSSHVNTLESRMNAMARLFGNGLFMFDFHSVTKLERWREKNAHAFVRWMESLAAWDALLSPATHCYNQPDFAFAQYTNALAMKMEEAGHPLIHANKRVTNNILLGEPAGVMLITGANMAGKSTFLRTVGVNFILARVGAPVCASSFICPMASLRSGMRTSDSLQEHQSYFFAELHRLQSIVNELKEGKPLLLLLDEILKGTNSTDKQLGSRELIMQFIHYPALVLLATHDVALGDMEHQHPGKIVNACFEGNIEGGALSFDYKMKPGVAQTANATFLMRQMGIIPIH